MNMNPKLTVKHLQIAIAVIVVVIVILKAVDSHKKAVQVFNSEFVVHTDMPTAEESIKWALMEAKAQYSSFEPVRTNVVFAPIEKTFRGKYDADREEANRQVFGSAYDSHDSFTRFETNWACDLTITHSEPKPPAQVSHFVKDEELAGEEETRPDSRLVATVETRLERKYSKYEILQRGFYKTERVRYGAVMKAVNTGNGVGYVWNTEDRKKTETSPAWVYFIEVGNVTEK